jgi:phosphoribosylanthranilate isomerase
MRVKVCGIGHLDQVPALLEAGADFAGFIFYPRSPRYILKNHPPEALKKERNINKIGVFVNMPAEELLQTVDDCGLHMVQLHGDETPRYCEKIANYINVIKAFRVTETTDIAWTTKDYHEVSDMFLFDTEGAGYGGTGKKFNWDLLQPVHMQKPFLLSGGIEPEDAERLGAFAATPVAQSLFAVDINSRFELSPGVKDMTKVRSFIKAVHEL